MNEYKLRKEAYEILYECLDNNNKFKKGQVGVESDNGRVGGCRYLYNEHNLPFLGKSFGNDGSELMEEFAWSRPSIEIFMDKFPQFKYFSKNRFGEFTFYSEIIDNIEVNYTEFNDDATFGGSGRVDCYYDIKKVKFNGLLSLTVLRKVGCFHISLHSDDFDDKLEKIPLSFPKGVSSR